MTNPQRAAESRNRNRLARQLALAADGRLPPPARKRASRLAAATAEKLGIIERPPRCCWCRCRARLERHHPSHSEPLAVLFLCKFCHPLADRMQASEALADKTSLIQAAC